MRIPTTFPDDAETTGEIREGTHYTLFPGDGQLDAGGVLRQTRVEEAPNGTRAHSQGQQTAEPAVQLRSDTPTTRRRVE